MLGIAALWCLDRYHRTRRPGWLAATGTALGLVALTKTEPLLAAAVAIVVGLALTLWSERPTGTRLFRLLEAFAAGLLLPLLATFLFFVAKMPAPEVLRGPLGYWRTLSRPEFAALPMYREGLGIDDVAGNLRMFALATWWYGVFLVPGVAAAFALRGVRRRAALIVTRDREPRGSRTPRSGQRVAPGGATDAPPPSAHDRGTARRMVPRTRGRRQSLAAGAQHRARPFRTRPSREDGAQRPDLPLRFALAMPAILVLIAALLSWRRRYHPSRRRGRALRAFAAGVLVAGLGAHLGTCSACSRTRRTCSATAAMPSTGTIESRLLQSCSARSGSASGRTRRSSSCPKG